MKLIELLQNAGADVAYHDPHVPAFAENGVAMSSVAARARAPTTASSSSRTTPASTTTQLVEDAGLVVDLRNATGRNGTHSDKVWKL